MHVDATIITLKERNAQFKDNTPSEVTLAYFFNLLKYLTIVIIT